MAVFHFQSVFQWLLTIPNLICWKTVPHTIICQNGSTGHLLSRRWCQGYFGSCSCVILSPFLFSVSSVPRHIQHNKSPSLTGQQKTQNMLSGLALPALLLCAPLLNTLFPLLPLGMVSSIWREKGKRAVFKANHKLKKMEWNRPSSSTPISPQAPVESRFASEILNCIVFQKLQRSSLLWGSLSLLVEELERSETSGHGPVWYAQHPGVWAEQLWACAGCRCLRLSLLTDKKYQWRCHFSSAGNFVT